jgi:hypothetical protein
VEHCIDWTWAVKDNPTEEEGQAAPEEIDNEIL